MVTCPLCYSNSVKNYYNSPKHIFLECAACTSVFRHPDTYLSERAEKQRYERHCNDVNDLGYQEFVNPIVEAVQANFTTAAKGLDYGAGTGPVITKLLTEKGYELALYDPYFHPDKAVLGETYDYIVCCEVIEHFYVPFQEFERLYQLLKPNGTLFCMTEFLPADSAQFEHWHYKNDLTHVVFYTSENLEFIQKNVGFSSLHINKRLITLTR